MTVAYKHLYCMHLWVCKHLDIGKRSRVRFLAGSIRNFEITTLCAELSWLPGRQKGRIIGSWLLPGLFFIKQLALLLPKMKIKKRHFWVRELCNIITAPKISFQIIKNYCYCLHIYWSNSELASKFSSSLTKPQSCLSLLLTYVHNSPTLCQPKNLLHSAFSFFSPSCISWTFSIFSFGW